MTYLSIDYGSKHIGLALGDDEIKIASPFRIFENKGVNQTFDHLKTVIKEEKVQAIVVGVPTIGTADMRQRTEVEEFVATLTKEVGMPVHMYDESFSSKEAQKMLRDTPEKKDHAVAAMLVLQSYFDSLR
ncbi:MAG: Holliday junction resolvase RuvX [bacterium]|nr:Holliday junction resolvase RuvX [bacterium]